MFRKRRMWSERTIRLNRLWWFAQTVPMTRKLIAYPRYEGHNSTSFSKRDSVPTTCGTPISTIRSVIAMANTPSEKASILPVSLSGPPLVVTGNPLLPDACPTVCTTCESERNARAPSLSRTPVCPQTPVCSPASSSRWGASALLGTLREVYLERGLFAVPEDFQLYRIARHVVAQRREQVARATDLLRTCGGHDVTAMYSGVVGRATRLDLFDQSPCVYGASELARGLLGEVREVDADVRVNGLAALDQLVRHGDSGGRRYGEGEVYSPRLGRREVG